MTALTRPTTRLRRQQAMELLARGLSPADVALQLGVSLRTVRRYLEDGELLAELRRAQSERLEALLRASLEAAPPALRTLQNLAADENAPQWARISAARAVIYQTLRLYETADLARRVERLEEATDSHPLGARQAAPRPLALRALPSPLGTQHLKGGVRDAPQDPYPVPGTSR